MPCEINPGFSDLINLVNNDETLHPDVQRPLRAAGADANGETVNADPTDPSEAIPELVTISYNDLMGRKFDQLWQPVDGLITEGLTVLVGGSKLGKSWLCMDMAYCVATGKPFLGKATTPCPVLYLALEDSLRRLQSRNHKLRQLVADVPNLEYTNQCLTMDNGFEQQISKWLNDHGGKCLVIVDVLQRIKGATRRRDGDAYQADYRNVGAIKAIADRFRAAFVVVHHTNKSKAQDDIYEAVSGSTGIMGVADTTILIRRKRGENVAEVDITGRDVYGDGFKICLDEDMHWNLIDDAMNHILYKGDPVVRTCDAILRANPEGLRISYNDFRAYGVKALGQDPARDGKDLRAKLIRIKDEALTRDGIVIVLPEKNSKATRFYKAPDGTDLTRSKETALQCLELSIRGQPTPPAAEQLTL